jgi:hypothetical protein
MSLPFSDLPSSSIYGGDPSDPFHFSLPIDSQFTCNGVDPDSSEVLS